MNKEKILDVIREMVAVIIESGSVVDYRHIIAEIERAIPDGYDTYYVVTYDNGSGYREWASTPQPNEERAWLASGLQPGQMNAQIEEVPVNTNPQGVVYTVNK